MPEITLITVAKDGSSKACDLLNPPRRVSGSRQGYSFTGIDNYGAGKPSTFKVSWRPLSSKTGTSSLATAQITVPNEPGQRRTLEFDNAYFNTAYRRKTIWAAFNAFFREEVAR